MGASFSPAAAPREHAVEEAQQKKKSMAAIRRTFARAAGALAASACVAGSVAKTEAQEPVVLRSAASRALFSVIRAEGTAPAEFSEHSDRLFGLLVEETLATLPGVVPKTVRTPCGDYDGLAPLPAKDVAVVSIMRAGDGLAEAFRRVLRGVAVGRILIQRDEASVDKRAKLYYSKLPKDIASKK